MNKTKTAMITVCGRPNVGKSSLTNALVGEKIAIVSNKPQTTRNRIYGVVNREDTQYILLDTPGLHKPKSALGDYMVKVVTSSLSDVDCALLLVEPIPHVGEPEKILLQRIREEKLPCVLCINKIDTVERKDDLLAVIAAYSEVYPDFDAIIPISARTGDGLEELLAQMLQCGCTHVVMEVSSQAYKQQRVYGVPFTVGLFLNLSEDHIGPLEHENFEDYFQCKLQLMKNCKLAVICRGTDRFEEIYAAAKAHAERVLVCGNDPSCDLWVENIRKETPGFTFTVCDKNSRRDFRITMEGRFNIENALAAITITRALGLPDDAIAAGIADVSVPGRMNVLQKDGRTVIVDYAHNFLSFTALFRSLKQDYPGAPIKVLCGCPGHKNLKRRVDIGHLCGEYADFVYLTAEDPGFEDPAEICREMAGYIGESHHRFIILPDRAAAVERSIAELAPGEILILAGKGEEDYQKVQGRYDFYESDLAIARRCLGL